MQAIQKQSLEKGLTYVANVPAPQIARPDEVLIRIKAAGICGTDVDIYRSDPQLMTRMKQHLPLITGHEFSGIIEEVGKGVHGLSVGDYVSAEMHIICGVCHNCRTGNGQWCLDTIIRGITGPGIFADYVVLPASAVISLPPELPPEVGAYLDAVGNAVHTVRSADMVGKDVAILGAGPMGIMATALCLLMGARRIFVTDVQENLLKAAKDEGADAVFNVGDEKQRAEFLAMCKSDPRKRGVDVVLELSGHATAYRDAFAAVRMGGEISLLGLPKGEIPVNFSQDVVFKGVTIRGIIGRKIFTTWVEMLALLQGPFLQTAKRVVTHKFALKDFEKGFAVKLSGQGLKVVLYPSGM
jgi:threonine 3-dehydrogenase